MMLDLTQKDFQAVEAIIESSSLITRAPIFVHFAHYCRKDVSRSAIKYFRHTALTHVPEKNAVLVFIARSSQRFSIVGDKGAHDKLEDDFWQACQLLLSEYFTRECFVEGCEAVVQKIAHALAEHYPPSRQG